MAGLRSTRVAVLTAGLLGLAPCAAWYLLRMPVVTVRNAPGGAEVRDVRLWAEGQQGRSREGRIEVVRPGEARSVRLWTPAPGALRLVYSGAGGEHTLAERCVVARGTHVTVELTEEGARAACDGAR